MNLIVKMAIYFFILFFIHCVKQGLRKVDFLKVVYYYHLFFFSSENIIYYYYWNFFGKKNSKLYKFSECYFFFEINLFL
ncbi:expressed protein [Phakopsora pachyrhizi]|uniref:Expressed protein n=1 Tax=Phakopsora pachyrhizi TaxID=170000 RepID=A0AAV0B2M5_PHAPC|nr:expressed protein [Phakopsora pachyrhizi]